MFIPILLLLIEQDKDIQTLLDAIEEFYKSVTISLPFVQKFNETSLVANTKEKKHYDSIKTEITITKIRGDGLCALRSLYVGLYKVNKDLFKEILNTCPEIQKPLDFKIDSLFEERDSNFYEDNKNSNQYTIDFAIDKYTATCFILCLYKNSKTHELAWMFNKDYFIKQLKNATGSSSNPLSETKKNDASSTDMEFWISLLCHSIKVVVIIANTVKNIKKTYNPNKLFPEKKNTIYIYYSTNHFDLFKLNSDSSNFINNFTEVESLQ